MLKTILQKGLDEQHYAGALCHIWQGEELKHKAIVGYANIPANERLTTTHYFDLASVTKLYTTTLVLHYISMKKLQFQTKVGELIEVPEVIRNVTIEQLLLHTSGITAWYPLYEETMAGLTFTECLMRFHVTKDAKVGTVTYSDLNFMLLRAICEKVESASFEQLVNELLEALKDSETTFAKGLNNSQVVATEFGNQIEQQMCNARQLQFNNWRPMNKPIVGEVNDGNAYYFFNGVSGHAGLFGTVNSLYKLASLYLKGGGSLIDAEIVGSLMQCNVNGRTYGFSKEGIFANGLGHTGFTGTMLYLEPTTSTIIVFLTNRLHVKQPKDLKAIREKVIDFNR